MDTPARTLVTEYPRLLIDKVISSQSPQSGNQQTEGSILSFLKYGDNTAPVYVLGDWELDIDQVVRERKSTGTLHDLQGRRLASPPNKGVYIQDGKNM